MRNDNSGAAPLERELRASVAFQAARTRLVFLTTAALRHLDGDLARPFAASVCAAAELDGDSRGAVRTVIRAWRAPRRGGGARWPENVDANAVEESMAEAWDIATEE